MVADGDVGEAEIEWLDRLAAHEQLGLARHKLHALLGESIVLGAAVEHWGLHREMLRSSSGN